MVAYGTAAGVSLLLGSDATHFPAPLDSDDVTAAITMADTIVDTLNSQASAAKKTLASNMIAARILLNSSQRYLTEGTQTIQNISGMDRSLITEEIMRVLDDGVMYIDFDDET